MTDEEKRARGAQSAAALEVIEEALLARGEDILGMLERDFAVGKLTPERALAYSIALIEQRRLQANLARAVEQGVQAAARIFEGIEARANAPQREDGRNRFGMKTRYPAPPPKPAA